MPGKYSVEDHKLNEEQYYAGMFFGEEQDNLKFMRSNKYNKQYNPLEIARQELTVNAADRLCKAIAKAIETSNDPQKNAEQIKAVEWEIRKAKLELKTAKEKDPDYKKQITGNRELWYHKLGLHTIKFTPMELKQKNEDAIQTQINQNQHLIEIVRTLKIANQDYLNASNNKDIKTKKSNTFHFSPLADTNMKYQHAVERDKELERLLRGAKTLPTQELQSRLEEHLRVYRQQEKHDREFGTNFFKKDAVQKMLDVAEKSLKNINAPASPTTVKTLLKRPKLQ